MLTLVSGLGRCGSSLMMQALAAGGVPVIGDVTPPYYEHPCNTGKAPVPDDLDGALKWLSPHVWAPPDVPMRTLFMYRNHAEQARSHIKFMRKFNRQPKSPAHEALILQRYMRQFARDEVTCMDLLHKRGPVLRLRFRDVLEDPHGTMDRVMRFIGRPLDTEAAAAVVRPRGWECLPFMLEQTL